MNDRGDSFLPRARSWRTAAGEELASLENRLRASAASSAFFGCAFSVCYTSRERKMSTNPLLNKGREVAHFENLFAELLFVRLHSIRKATKNNRTAAQLRVRATAAAASTFPRTVASWTALMPSNTEPQTAVSSEAISPSLMYCCLASGLLHNDKSNTRQNATHCMILVIASQVEARVSGLVAC